MFMDFIVLLYKQYQEVPEVPITILSITGKS